MNNNIKNIIPEKINEYKTAIGIMNGTSLDGIDVILIDLKGCGADTQFITKAFRVFPIPSGLKLKMRAIMHSGRAALEDICRINYDLARLYASCIKKMCVELKIDLNIVDFIGISGQTFYHIPKKATLQLGSGSYLSSLLSKTVVWDFRAADIAAGGQGAPLAPYLDYILFAKKKIDIIALNIGGISNLTYIPAGADFKLIRAFDCGPGNMIIDKMAIEISGGKNKFDKNARFALRGKNSSELLKLMKSHPFLMKKPPKSTGREEFGDDYAAGLIEFCGRRNIKPYDMIRTATDFSVYCIVRDIEKYILNLNVKRGKGNLRRMAECSKEIYLICSGGGARNPLILKMLDERLGIYGIKTVTSEYFNIDSKSKEALLMAILANETIYGRPSNVPSATGANKKVICGSVAYQ